jgi:hypothetical protein
MPLNMNIGFWHATPCRKFQRSLQGRRRSHAGVQTYRYKERKKGSGAMIGPVGDGGL